MGYKVNYKGLEVVCDTADEVDLLAERASGHIQRSFLKPMPIKQAPSAPSVDDAMTRFVNSLPEKTIGVLSVLVANGEMTDKTLREHLKLDNNMQLAGRIATISRSAKKFGLTADDVLRSRMINNKPGHRKYVYSVPDGAGRYIRRRTEGSE